MLWYFNFFGGLSFSCFGWAVESKLSIFGGFLMLAFLVKVPLFGVHLWLPKAHVEAPVRGSIILAGVLLKIGGYGLIRVFFLLKGLVFFPNILLAVTLLGAIYISIKCIGQVDLKSLVAYSSVVHMALVVGGLLSLKALSWKGGVFLILGHGFCSSCIFFLLGVMYDRIGRRRIILNKGVSSILPGVSLWWFISCAGNISNPPRLSLFGEVILIRGILRIAKIVFLILILIFLGGSCYTVHLFSGIYHGFNFKFNFSFFNIRVNEIIISFLHLICLNSIFFLLK